MPSKQKNQFECLSNEMILDKGFRMTTKGMAFPAKRTAEEWSLPAFISERIEAKNSENSYKFILGEKLGIGVSAVYKINLLFDDETTLLESDSFEMCIWIKAGINGTNLKSNLNASNIGITAGDFIPSTLIGGYKGYLPVCRAKSEKAKNRDLFSNIINSPANSWCNRTFMVQPWCNAHRFR